MQERKTQSAFRLSSKQSDSLKMKNSLNQLLGVSSRSRIEDHMKDIDNSTPQSTSTSARYGAGPLNSSKDKNTGAFFGMKGATMDSDLFGPHTGIFAQLKKTLDEIAMMKSSQRHHESQTSSLFGDMKLGLNFDFDFTKNLLAELNKKPSGYNPLFPLEMLGGKEQQGFNAKGQHLQNLEQQLATSQTSENSPITKTGYQIVPIKATTKFDDRKMDIQKRKDSYHDISSFNSLEEEVDSNVKPTTQLNHLSISSGHQFDGLNLRTVKSEANTSTDEKCGSFLVTQDLSKATLQQRLEYHYARNGKGKSEDDEGAERRLLLGIYPLDERIQKILHYKKKIVKWRAAHPPNRNFSGRSAVAGSKPRIKGKFVKKDEYQKYLEVQKKSSMN